MDRSRFYFGKGRGSPIDSHSREYRPGGRTTSIVAVRPGTEYLDLPIHGCLVGAEQVDGIGARVWFSTASSRRPERGGCQPGRARGRRNHGRSPAGGVGGVEAARRPEPAHPAREAIATTGRNRPPSAVHVWYVKGVASSTALIPLTTRSPGPARRSTTSASRPRRRWSTST